MKIAALATTAAAVLMLGVAPVLAQTSPPVTMQPIPNPPEKPMMHTHKAKHHKKASAPAAPAKDAPATPSK
jgi:hypothetical protein